MKYGIQSSNVNFLFGSGLSMPFLKTLGNIEKSLTELNQATDLNPKSRKVILASIRKVYFDLCISGNYEILNRDPSSIQTLKTYQSWLVAINQILLNRRSTLLNKQANLFTTNMDIFTELALETIGAEYCDGFYGTIAPVFGLSNFKKSVLKTSQQYGVATEIPMFNLFKLHGSVGWKMLENETIGYDHGLLSIKKIRELNINMQHLVDAIDPTTKLIKSMNDLNSLATAIRNANQADAINTIYEDLVMVNPTKEKFKTTTLNRTYYELLRMYANELERENSVLFVMGFSFADEHIAEVTLRAARSNPTLKIYIYAYNSGSEAEIKDNLGFSDSIYPNIRFVEREKIKDENGEVTGEVPHDLGSITSKGFAKLAEDTSDRK